MASMNKDEFIAMVEGMTVLELHEIVKALEDRFGVTAAAPTRPGKSCSARGSSRIAVRGSISSSTTRMRST